MPEVLGGESSVTLRQQKPVSRTCANCGDRKCRRRFRAVCWTCCGRWIKEVLPLEAVPVLCKQKDT